MSVPEDVDAVAVTAPRRMASPPRSSQVIEVAWEGVRRRRDKKDKRSTPTLLCIPVTISDILLMLIYMILLLSRQRQQSISQKQQSRNQ